MLQQLKANVVIQPNGFCSISTKVPQIMLVTDLKWLQQPQLVPASLRWYHQVFMKQSINKAVQIVTLTEKLKQDLLSNYPTSSGKVSLVYAAANPLFQPVDYDKKRQTKDGYADGREYFLYSGNHHSDKNILELLKAFSLLKKWQKSNMKLLVAGNISNQKKGIADKLKSYKYKDDVVLLPTITEQQLALITAAAYTVIHPFFYEPLAMPILSSMQTGVPVVVINPENIDEIGGDTCLYSSPNDNEGLANELKLLYRDELLGRSLVEKGLKTTLAFNWERTGDLFWDIILKANS
jgi:glycosyltransferase involved in cell wall biosynthesis